MTAGAAPAQLELFQTIDARGWEPPEPMVRVLEALDGLPSGGKIVMLLFCQPRPLFRILKHNGFDYDCRLVPEGYFEVTIWRAAPAAASRAHPD